MHSQVNVGVDVGRLRTVKDVVDSLSKYPIEEPLPAPDYRTKPGSRIALVVPSMERHMSNEGWQLGLALHSGGYELCGHGLSTTLVPELLLMRNPSVVMVQDQHEWDDSHMKVRDPGHLAIKEEYFHNVKVLADRPDIFKLTVVKDTHRQYESAKKYSADIGCHAWIIYYNPDIVLRTLNWLRPQHVIRTWHTIDPATVPPYEPLGAGRQGCLLSGSLGGAYPLRTRIANAHLPEVTMLKHPGYGNKGSSTPDYLKELSKYKVAICTSSKFGYALRKIIEATACGCRVITDLPTDEILPVIDGNLVRVSPDIGIGDLRQLVTKLVDDYSPPFQEAMAKQAKARYDYWTEGVRLTAAIDLLRTTYQCTPVPSI